MPHCAVKPTRIPVTTVNSARYDEGMRKVTFALLLLVCACSSKKDATPATDGGTGDDAAIEVDSAVGARVTDKGVMTDHDTNKLLAGVLVTEGDATSTTDAQGAFSLSVLMNTPITLVMAAPDHTKLQWPEVMLSGDVDRGKITTVSLSTFGFVGASLDGYDHSLGVLYVDIGSRATCADVTGATVAVASPAGTTTRYFKHGVPNAAQTSVLTGESPHIAIYNIAVGVPVSVTVSHPTCKTSAFPYTEGVVTYTGQNITTEGGDTNTVVRLFLE